jgi:N utilization substance protein B
MGKRRSAREMAFQVLFEFEFNDVGIESILARAVKDKQAECSVQEYAGWLARGIMARRDEIDALIQSTSDHWRVSRMALVDRNILRVAVFELLEEKFLAPAIVINEAIEIAKRFSGDQAAVFVNGVLDAVRKRLDASKPQEKETKDERTQEPAKKRAAAGRRRPQKA